MIIRILVIDPKPRKPWEDLIVYQVPERSRAQELLVELLERHNLEYVKVLPKRKKKEPKDV